ncbi:MAG: hypothetical protein KF805_08615 [Phycisphaeraceae bacterium]|nr:hypothetical protein [Phycisphaeraceae bacterium]
MNKQSWPEFLDAVIAAPDFHRVLLENSTVRVLETLVPPGRTVPLHTHRWPGAHYFVQPGEYVRRDENGNVTADSRKGAPVAGPGEAVWSPPLGPHTFENIGVTAIRVISVEIKSTP